MCWARSLHAMVAPEGRKAEKSAREGQGVRARGVCVWAACARLLTELWDVWQRANLGVRVELVCAREVLQVGKHGRAYVSLLCQALAPACKCGAGTHVARCARGTQWADAVGVRDGAAVVCAIGGCCWGWN